MTLIYELDLDPHTRNEVSRSRLSKVRAQTGRTDRQTDRQTDPTARISTPHSQVVTIQESVSLCKIKNDYVK